MSWWWDLCRVWTVTATSHHYPALSQPGDTTPTILQPTIKYQQYVLTLKFFDDCPNDHLCLIIIMLCRWLGVELISNLALLGQTLPTPQGIYTQEGNYLMDSRQVGIFNSCVYIPCYSRFTPRNKIAIVKSKMFFFFILTLSNLQNILSKNKPKVYKVRYNINWLVNSHKKYLFHILML